MEAGGLNDKRTKVGAGPMPTVVRGFDELPRVNEIEGDLRGLRGHRLRGVRSRHGFGLSTRRLCSLPNRRVLRLLNLSMLGCRLLLVTHHPSYSSVRMVFASLVDVR